MTGPAGRQVRRGAVAGGVLAAEVEEGEKDGVLVRRGEAALVEELEDALGEGEGGVGIGVEEQGGILGGGAEVSRTRAVRERCCRWRPHAVKYAEGADDVREDRDQRAVLSLKWRQYLATFYRCS